MSLASKLKMINMESIAPVAFYGLIGIIFLIMLPLSGFPPHIGLMGASSLIVAYGLFKNRFWAIWLVVALFFVATTFTLYTLYYIMTIDVLATAGMIAYAVLTWIFTAYVISKRKPEET